GPAPSGRRWTARVPSIFAAVLTVLAVLCAVAAVSQVYMHRMQPLRESVNALLLPAPPNLGYAAFVGVLAAGVARRKRVAYWMLIAYFALQLLVDLMLFAAFAMPESFWDDQPLPWPWFGPWLNLGNLAITVGVLVV